jgi:hypothetical protein
MNSQLKEVLVINGKEVAMACEPLKQYFDQLKSPPQLLTVIRANERGYLGKWAIIDNKLYLIGFIGVLNTREEIALEDIFPEKQIVFAEWFNGEIVLNQGRILALKNEFQPATYEKDIHLDFVNGYLINTYVVENTLDQIAVFTDRRKVTSRSQNAVI